jgi:hypothetical protein
LHCGGQRFESPQLHQVVRANRCDFLRRRIARHFRSLPSQVPVSVGVRRFSGAIPGASCRKSLAANFRFQGCCLPLHRARSFDLRGFEPRPLTRFGWMDQPLAERQTSKGDRSLRLRRRLESERPPLIRPGHRQVDETLETKAAWQASFDCRLDDLRREESERQGHPDRTLSLALSRSERLQSQAGSERSSSSQRCASRRASIRIARALAGIGRA